MFKIKCDVVKNSVFAPTKKPRSVYVLRKLNTKDKLNRKEKMTNKRPKSLLIHKNKSNLKLKIDLKDRLNSKKNATKPLPRNQNFLNNNQRWKHNNVVNKAKPNAYRQNHIMKTNYKHAQKDNDVKWKPKNAGKLIANSNYKKN